MSRESVDEACSFLRHRGFDRPFACAMVLGTGLGGLADQLEDPARIPYAEIPHFPRIGVSGHAGALVAGRIGQKYVLVFQGRAHFYESADAAAMRVPIGLVGTLGAPPLLLTNAAGSTRPDFGPSSLVAFTDHLNLAGANPLIGERREARFVSMTGAYDPGLRQALHRAASAENLALHEGVYAWFSGPSFETPAEIRMARLLGADLVGMSTVPEVILARYHGLKVAAVSVVTNMAAGIEGAAPSHAETKAVAAGAASSLTRLIRAFVSRIDDV